MTLRLRWCWRRCTALLLCLAAWVTSCSATECPKGCSLHGTCNQEVGRCDCPRHRTGPACETELTGAALLARCKQLRFRDAKSCGSQKNRCLTDCNGRGTCVAGFCHCRQGFYGRDCSLSTGADGKPAVLADRGYQPRARGPRVYVYDLPPSTTSWLNELWNDRPTTSYFVEHLMATGARVADGDAADWYLIPVRLRWVVHTAELAEALEYIQAAHPWFNRTQGHRHFVIMTGDTGRSELLIDRHPLAANLTFVTHWGLAADRTDAGWPASHRNATDIVLPVFLTPNKLERLGVFTSRNHPRFAEKADLELQERNGPLFYFTGRVCGDRSKPRLNGRWPHCATEANARYSMGTRQKVHFHHWNRTGFFIRLSDPDYSKHMLTSKFCFGPTGGGHGQRQIQAVLTGCVPVLISDHVLEAFEPYLDWGSFGVRVAEADIPRLHTIVKGISHQDYARKVSRLRCAAQHLAFASVTGAYLGEGEAAGRFDAFATLLEILRAKAAHPDAPPEQLRRLDPQLDAFMDCRDYPLPARASGSESDQGRKALPVRGTTASVASSVAGGVVNSGGSVAAVAAGRDTGRPAMGGGGGGDGAGVSNVNSTQMGPAGRLCSLSKFDVGELGEVVCRELRRRGGGGGGGGGGDTELTHGGAMCAWTPDNLAACLRPWQ